jgi:DHA2 family multidrug resistance protein
MNTDSALLMVVSCLIRGSALVCLFLALVFVWNNKLRQPLPLYEIDVVGLLLLAFLIMLIEYVVVYGRSDNWRESGNITVAGILIPMMLFAFIARQLIVH